MNICLYVNDICDFHSIFTCSETINFVIFSVEISLPLNSERFGVLVPIKVVSPSLIEVFYHLLRIKKYKKD